jgi:hypothetical protein
LEKEGSSLILSVGFILSDEIYGSKPRFSVLKENMSEPQVGRMG